MSETLKRCAILGTAQSWKECPFGDQSLEVWGLNDAYMVGVPRANRWYDLHPFYQMYFRGEKSVPIAEVPPGCYLRPNGHLEWLKTRPFPVYLAQQRADYPTSRTFPIDEILGFFQPFWPYRLTRHKQIVSGKDYEVSTPSWMLMHAIAEGYQEIHVYGIHLATQWEYLQQRPNFEWLLGFAAGRGIRIVLPESTPICRAAYRYAFEPKADIPLQQIDQQIAQIKADGATQKLAMQSLPWYQRSARKETQRKLQRAEVLLTDARQAQQRVLAQMGS